MTPESFLHALQHLDPGSRALLDLSLHRGLEDDEIAELLGADPGYVSSSREAAIAQLAADLGMHANEQRVREALSEMPEEAWRPQLESETAGQPDSGAVNGSAPAEPMARRRWPVSRGLLALLLVIAVAVVVIVLASSGGGSKSTPEQRAARPPPSKPAAPVKGGVALRSLSPSSSAKGSAQLTGRRLTLSVSGLPQRGGSYEVWLYNDEIDAAPVTTFRSGSATVKAKLPQPPARYRYLDVSLEPADGNANHSGASVLRVPLRALR